MTVSQLLVEMTMNNPEYLSSYNDYVFRKIKSFKGFNAVGISNQLVCTNDEVRLYSANGNGLMHGSSLSVKLTEKLMSGEINPATKVLVDGKELLYIYYRDIIGFGNSLVLSTDKKTLIERLIEKFLK